MLIILALAEPRLTTFETKMAVAVLAGLAAPAWADYEPV